MKRYLKAKFTNSDYDLWSLGNTVYRSFFFRFEPSKPSHKRTFRARKVSLSNRTTQTFVTGRFGPISIDLSDTQRVVSVPTVVSAFSRRPFTRTHQTLLFGFSQIIYTFFQFLIKVFIPFVYLPTYTLPLTYFHPPTDLPPPTHPPTCYLPTYLHPPTHTPDNLPPLTYIHPTTIFLPTSTQIPIHLPTSIHPTPATHQPTYLPINKPNPHFSTHISTYLPTYHLPDSTNPSSFLPTHLPTN